MNELNFENFDPAHEISVTQDLFGEVVGEGAAAASAPAVPAGEVLTDRKGTVFDPDRHLVDELGKPVRGSVGQFKLKPSAKKSTFKKIVDAANPFHSEESEISEEPEISENKQENNGIPMSDHERKEEVERNLRDAEAHAARQVEIDVESEDTAHLIWMGYSAALGPESLNQYEKLHPKVKKHVQIFEARTGKSIDFPPGVALTIGIATVGLEIVRAEPECQKRFNAAKDIITTNLGGYVKNAFAKNDDPEISENKEGEHEKV